MEREGENERWDTWRDREGEREREREGEKESEKESFTLISLQEIKFTKIY